MLGMQSSRSKVRDAVREIPRPIGDDYRGEVGAR